ncbi:hypothetical protein E3N88_38586 [Mikania micrantha]|uniref:Uncharacterized protein n=1 Tax=Mikania micrantha TaxID=192012 RepID=A0A5N6LUG3_9ASTR|nr:hypothetical protein E3N88_38586 [Mikania micrantha]
MSGRSLGQPSPADSTWKDKAMTGVKEERERYLTHGNVQGGGVPASEAVWKQKRLGIVGGTSPPTGNVSFQVYVPFSEKLSSNVLEARFPGFLHTADASGVSSALLGASVPSSASLPSLFSPLSVTTIGANSAPGITDFFPVSADQLTSSGALRGFPGPSSSSSRGKKVSALLIKNHERKRSSMLLLSLKVLIYNFY